MKIAIVHYHLKPGGVTNVIKHQLDALSGECEILLLSGELPDPPIYTNTIHIPGLGYNEAMATFPPPERIANDLSQSIISAFGDKCDVLHVHNPILAKNKHFLAVLKFMQKKGYNLFLQVHDFAEDGRPLAYYDNDSYISNCHYGAINSRDYRVLHRSGLKSEGLHLLPNMISPIQITHVKSLKRHRVLYPVRALRRKNIGEAILLSLFFRDKTLSITLPPNSAADINSYTGWKEFVNKNNLNIEFDSGLHMDFPTLVSSSDFFISTSITEGFGFSFLESWTADKMLWGRLLPDICSDFTKNGVHLNHLYERLNVPVPWMGEDALLNKLMSCISESAKKLHYPLNTKHTLNTFKKNIRSGSIDFGLLDETFQKQVIAKVLSSRKNKQWLKRANPNLLNTFQTDNKTELISNNKKSVLLNYNKNVYKNSLINIYHKVMNGNVTHQIDKNTLTSFFLNPDTFSLLKWSEYAE